MKHKFFVILVVLSVALVAGGCSSINHHGEGALSGATLGGVVGYSAGGNGGAVIGTILGGVIGGEMGESFPKKEGVQERKMTMREREIYLNRAAIDGYLECRQTGLSADYCARIYKIGGER